MDDARFDALTQRLGFASTRRRATLSVLGSVGAGLLFLFETDVATSRKKKKKKKCKSSQKKCGSTCIPRSACCGGCGDLTCCNGRCVNLASDLENCGACGRACSSDRCFNGVCKCGIGTACPAPCNCQSRQDDNSTFGCVGEDTQTACSSDRACSVGSTCLATGFCATACPGQ